MKEPAFIHMTHGTLSFVQPAVCVMVSSQASKYYLPMYSQVTSKGILNADYTGIS